MPCAGGSDPKDLETACPARSLRTSVWRAGAVLLGLVLGSMARDVFIRFLLMALMPALLLSVSPHYSSTSRSRASVARRGWASGSEDPKVALFGETHGDRYARTQDHPQWSSVVGKASASELTSVASIATRSRRATSIAPDDLLNQHAIQQTQKINAKDQGAYTAVAAPSHRRRTPSLPSMFGR